MTNADTKAQSSEPSAHEKAGGHDWRLGRFPNLMPRRIEEILLVSSAYDSFILEEDGLLTELIYSEYADLGLTHAPTVTRVATGEEALELIREGRFDLVITMQRLGDMDVERFGESVRALKPDLPIVLLIASDAELARIASSGSDPNIDGTYVWHGDAKIFLAIIKVLEDKWNAEHDTHVASVGVIILIEDSRRYRSSLLPIMYAELVKQTRSVMTDGINRMHRLMRMRARPKILVAETYEQGIELYDRFRKYLFGVIADVRFPRDGVADRRAGIDFIRHVKEGSPDVPVLLQSSDPQNRALAESVGAAFLNKRSSTLLEDIREFMLANFGFGDFIFRTPDGVEVARAADLRAMEKLLASIPLESVEYHARRNHFSNWMRARTEFALARRMRPRKITEFGDLEELRQYLIVNVRDARRTNRRGVVEDFSGTRFDRGSHIARIGGGSMGGKARGLAFADAMLARQRLDDAYENVTVFVPQSVVIGTDIFDEFLKSNRLRLQALQTDNDEWITWAFQTAKLPERVVRDLRAYIDIVRDPIAVRSSSLLEDSQTHPFAGIYATFMIPNNHEEDRVRLSQLCDAIKLVYASTYSSAARRYLEATPHRIEEDKMAVILQPIAGRRREHYYYPSFAGAALSYNFYPFGHMKPDDGVATVAIGLGLAVSEGDDALRFCPAHPQILPQLSYGEKYISQSQRGFYAIDLNNPGNAHFTQRESSVVRLGLEDAERHGTLAPVGSVWSNENKAFYDGIYRDGVRVVTFAHVLKSDLFPLADIIKRLLDLGRAGMNGPVEIEFAVNLDTDPKEFAVLQMRPASVEYNQASADIGEFDRSELLCYSTRAMGNGLVDGVCDIVYVKPDAFDASQTTTIAADIDRINQSLRAEQRHCMLIGPGRWGSANTTLGIPVKWTQISTARIIVEAALETFKVDPSQGSHFFHNLTSFGVAYLTVRPNIDGGFVDWDWLNGQAARDETPFVRHVRLEEPIEARIDGRTSRAAVLKVASRNNSTSQPCSEQPAQPQ